MSRDFRTLRLRSLMRGIWSCTVLLVGGMVMSQTSTEFIAAGDSLLLLDKPQRALDQYEHALKVERTAKTHMARARAYYALDRMDLFLQDVDRSLRLDTGYAEAHYNRAIYAFRADDLGLAEYHTTKAIDLTTDDQIRTKSLILRGEARAEMKRINPAISDLEAGTAVDDSDLEVLRTLARLYDASGRYEDALAVLTKLCQKDSTEVGHWSNRAFELIQLGRFEEALPMAEKALDIDKDEPVALSNRGYIYYTMGRIKEADQDVDRSLRFYPANPYALRTRALLRLRKGDREKACEDLTLAKALGDIPEVDRLVIEHCASQGSKR